jgi:hypothetical protein
LLSGKSCPKAERKRVADDLNSIEEMSDDVLFCKANSRHTYFIEELIEGRWDSVKWRCEICGRVRHVDYDANGRILADWYEPLPGSKIAGMERSDFRREMFRRYKGGGMLVARPKREKRKLRSV